TSPSYTLSLSLHDALPIFDTIGATTPPCGVPLSGCVSSPASSTPACSHLPISLRIPPSLTLCVINSRRGPQSRLSKNPLTSASRSEEHTSELQSRFDLVCR